MRRGFYQNQINRNREGAVFQGEYLEFIRSCDIRLHIIHTIPDNIDRVQELVQRTNQMNFSGNRYQRQSIEELINTPEFDKYTLQCEDKFGNYGTVGFCVVDNRKPQLIDLMFSCRIQSKRIEHAFISWLLHHYRALNFDIMYAKYKKTPKNTPAGQVFKDFGFNEIQNINNDINYEFDLTGEIPWDGLIIIELEGEQWTP
jgi:FkbH-like protein